MNVIDSIVPSPKRVLLTGVTGQDASYMADYLLDNTDHLVYGMVRRTANPNYGNLTRALNHPRFQLVAGDLSDSQSIDDVVRKIRPDFLINLAAQSFVFNSWQAPEMTFDVDALGVLRCLEAVRKHVPQCIVYSAGSSEQWGNVAYSPQDENHPMRPRSPYGAAKCAASHIVKVYRESYGLYAIHGILCNHESERRGMEFVTRKITLGVARIARALQDNCGFEPIELGNLDAVRDWSHAEDFVDGIWRMVHQEKYRTDLSPDLSWSSLVSQLREYVLSSGETHTIREFVELAFDRANIEGEWIRPEGVADPLRETYRMISSPFLCLVRINPQYYRPADVETLCGDSTKARLELGWSPKVSFHDLVARMVKSDLAAVGL